MFESLGRFVSRYWCAVILGWAIVVALVVLRAPRWDDVTEDGDLAYLPQHLPSVAGERLQEQAFPQGRAKSDVVVVFARSNSALTPEDLQQVDRLASRLTNLHACSSFRRSLEAFQQSADLRQAGDSAAADRVFLEADALQRQAVAGFDEALRLDPESGDVLNNRAFVSRWFGQHEEARQHQRLALDFSPHLKEAGTELRPVELGRLPIIDVWTRHTDVVGPSLRSKDRQSELIMVRMSQEFMATDNIRVLELIENEIDQFLATTQLPPDLQVALTGSAAVGGDMYRSAAESIKNTERYTVLLVVLILIVVYRAPLLVAVPLITIGVSVVTATGFVASLTQLQTWTGWSWWNFRIFTTTKIFVVVILFGAGTDFCLFLIARYREELAAGHPARLAVQRALQGVGNALTASALTTIVGLATMFFAEFGKFRNSGPAIGFCLAVTLVACMTLAPAMLASLGAAVFWPFGGQIKTRRGWSEEGSLASRWWERVSRTIVQYPGRVLVVCTLVLLPFAVQGTSVRVTYDFLSELSPTRPSRQGAKLLREHFPVGETGPLVVLARVPGVNLETTEAKRGLAQLTELMYVEGVQSVRSIAAPRGDKPQGYSIKNAAMQSHALTRSLYLSQQSGLDGDVARFEVILGHDPFSIEATQVLNRLHTRLDSEHSSQGSFWQGAEFLFAGTTAAIRDLRQVTRRDNLLIQVLVVLAVLLVLLVILRRPVVCIYLILSVLFSYYVTLGMTELVFRWTYGATYEGLDWKVPLFLFVILVAIGQDYNIYLATRVFEEQAQHGLFGGLRRAIVRTGGIITSCGIIMAGTFVSMTTGTLRGVVELGFALSLGVLLDTFVVRPVLVPAFLAILFRLHQSTPRIGNWMQSGGSRGVATTSSSPTGSEPL